MLVHSHGHMETAQVEGGVDTQHQRISAIYRSSVKSNASTAIGSEILQTIRDCGWITLRALTFLDQNYAECHCT